MGVTGTGSTEQGDASGEVFWMPYNPTFLEFFYETFPEEMPKPANAEPVQPAVQDSIAADGDDVDDPEGSENKLKVDQVEGFPNIRLSRAPVASRAGRLSRGRLPG